MKRKVELEEAIKDTITRRKDIILGSDMPSFVPYSSISSRCSFVISFTLALAWFRISALSL